MRILAVKTHAFGDALLTTPAVAGLVEQGHRVTVVAGPSSLPVWRRFPGLEKVIASPAPCSFWKLLLWSIRSRQRGYRRAIHFGSSGSAAAWVRFIAGCPVTSGAGRETGFGLVKPAAADYCRIAGVSRNDLRPVFPLDGKEIRTAERLIGGGEAVVFAPGGGRNPREYVAEKRWPAESWRKVMRRFGDRGYRVLAVGGREESAEFDQLPCENLAGKLTWGETAAVISLAGAFAGSDSGPAHLSVAVGTPAVVLFGPTDPDSLYVRDSIRPVRATEECSPCYSNSVFPGCGKTGGCMGSIDPERVINELEGILGK